MHLYAIEFESGIVKVGKSSRARQRIAEHVAQMSCAGLALVREEIALCIGNASSAESVLIGRCAAVASSQRRREWFTGLQFDEVVRWMKDAATNTPLPDTDAPYVVRSSDPWIDAGGSYVCRACCKFFPLQAARSGYVCNECTDAGYRFLPKLKPPTLMLSGKRVGMFTAAIGAPDAKPYPGVVCEALRPDLAWLRLPLHGLDAPFMGKALVDTKPPDVALPELAAAHPDRLPPEPAKAA